MPSEWSGIALLVNILLLAAGWFLYRQARADLTAQALQQPVLTEVKSLQKSVATLIEQLKIETAQAGTQLDARCLDAREQIAALDRRLEELREMTSRGVVRKRSMPGATARERLPEQSSPEASPADLRNHRVYDLADSGLTPEEVAVEAGITRGEVDLILALRSR